MGAGKSEEKKEFDVKINHPRFHKAKIVTVGDRKYLETVLAVDEKEYDRWKLATGKYIGLPNLLLPVKSEFARTAMCGHTGNATIDFDNHPYLLTEEIYDRKGKRSRFTEVQIWFLLYSLVKAWEQAIKGGQSLCDIRPSNIFLNEDGKIKVTSSLSWPLETSNIQKAMDKQTTYLAPEDLNRISRNELFDGPQEISQSFSVGLTALSVGSMTSFENLYDLSKTRFHEEAFNEALMYWRGNSSFSEVLRGTVSLLCCLDPARRLTISELKELLEKHHQSIEEKVNFLIDNAPLKLHEQIMHSRQLLRPQGYVPVQIVNPVPVAEKLNGSPHKVSKEQVHE